MISPMQVCDALSGMMDANAPASVHSALSASHRTIERAGFVEMNQRYTFKIRRGRTLILTAVLGACGLVWAQQPPAEPQKAPPSKPPAESNPFPEDTTNVPVVPASNAPAAPAANAAPPALPSGADDPVRSPDDPVGDPEAGSNSEFSSSSAGLDKIQPPPDEEPTRRHRGKGPQEPDVHQETAKEDEDVGSLYLSQKNWRAALSRFESAVVLDPENPDVYWALAESQRHLGQFAAAKANYEKVMEYDPDSKHAKEAKKLLGSPEMAGMK
ncbi:tetratricopeptide repeat protein [Acidobacteria bacterium AB60]|nr:tetratricopeptide repeat protein [Acidobacteria bacterium AB60]